MKKAFSILLVVALVVGLFWAMQPREYVNEHLVEKTRHVTFDRVNVRAEPSLDADIIGEKYEGQEVVLTGKIVEYLMSDIYSLWFETIEGGWIVADALK